MERRKLELSGPGAGTWKISANATIATARAQKRPLVQAPDAIYVDSGGLTIEEVEEQVLKIVRERTANGKEYSR